MITYIALTTLFIMGVYLCFSLNQLNKDIKYIRLSLDELETSIKKRTWIVHDKYKRVQ
jgi:hypothetical protein